MCSPTLNKGGMLLILHTVIVESSKPTHSFCIYGVFPVHRPRSSEVSPDSLYHRVHHQDHQVHHNQCQDHEGQVPVLNRLRYEQDVGFTDFPSLTL